MGWRDRLLNSKPETVGRALSKGPHGHGSMPQLSTHNKGGRVGLTSGTKLTKEQKRKKLSQQVSAETLRESMRDVDIKNKKPKVHTTLEGRKASFKRINKLRKDQGYFFPEKTLKKNFGDIRDKGWGGKHSRKVVHN